MEIVTLIAYMFMSFGLIELLLFFNGPWDIIEKFRVFMNNLHAKLGELFSCPACLSSWVGIIFSAINYFFITVPITPFNMILGTTGLWWLIIPMDLFFTAGTTWTLYQLDEFLEKNSKEYTEEIQ